LDSLELPHQAYQVPEFRSLLEAGILSFGTLDHLTIGDTKMEINWTKRQGISLFFSHPWFERIWIYQEVAVSRQVVFFDGTMPWEFISDAPVCLKALQWRLDGGFMRMLDDEVKTDHILQLDRFRQSAKDGPSMSLVQLLSETREFKSTEPVDRIHGLLVW
jgi:hypothetical protein